MTYDLQFSIPVLAKVLIITLFSPDSIINSLAECSANSEFPPAGLHIKNYSPTEQIFPTSPYYNPMNT